MNVLLADDHPITREGLRILLDQDEGIHIVGEASNGEEVLHQCAIRPPDLVILDLKMPKINGWKVAQQLFNINNHIKIIFYTQFVSPFMVESARKIKNVKGIITKTTPTQELCSMILNACINNTFVQSVTECESDTQETWDPDIDIEQLTVTEKVILKMISKQMSSKDISLSSNMSLKTVKSHRYNICRKLGLTGQNSLLSYALQHHEWI